MGLGKPAAVSLPTLAPSSRTLTLQSPYASALPGGGAVVDLGAALGRPGMPWRGGLLHLEKHPDLVCRGAVGEPSVWWDLANDPLIAGMRKKLKGVLAGTPYRVDPAPLPDWHKGNPLAEYAREVQAAYCRRIFAGWSCLPKGGFKRFVRESADTVPVEGWGWWEIVAQTQSLDLGDLGTHDVLMPALPAWRAPWAVWWWVTQDEELLGVVAGFGHSQDRIAPYQDGPRPKWQTFIPTEKILHVSTGQIGSNHEGVSWQRPHYNQSLMKRDGAQLEALAFEVAGVKELFFRTDPSSPPMGDNQTKLQDYINHRKARHAPGAALAPGVEPVWSDTSMVDFDPFMHRQDRAISQAWSQDERMMSLDNTGSYAARESASGDGRDLLDDTIGELVTEPIEELFGRMIRASFPDFDALGLVFPPSLGYGQVEEVDQGAYVTTLSVAVGAGLVTWTPDDEANLRELIDLTVMDEGAMAHGPRPLPALEVEP